MTGAHARSLPPARPGRAVAVLGLLGVLPPTMILAPRLVDAPQHRSETLSRPDVAAHGNSANNGPLPGGPQG